MLKDLKPTTILRNITNCASQHIYLEIKVHTHKYKTLYLFFRVGANCLTKICILLTLSLIMGRCCLGVGFPVTKIELFFDDLFLIFTEPIEYLVCHCI